MKLLFSFTVARTRDRIVLEAIDQPWRAILAAADVKEGGFKMQRKVLSDEEYAELVKVMEPIVKWLAANYPPHYMIVMDSQRVELLAGVTSFSSRPQLMQ